MKRPEQGLGLGFLAAVAAGMSVQAQTISIQAIQDPSGVTMSYAGSVSLTGWFSYQTQNHAGGAGRNASGDVNGLLFNSSTPSAIQIFVQASATPGATDLANPIPAADFSGNALGFGGIVVFGSPYAMLGVPLGYTSGSALAGSMKFPGATLADLTLAAGQAKTFALPGNTITITPAVVPEPSEWAAIGAGLCGGVALFRRLRPRANGS